MKKLYVLLLLMLFVSIGWSQTKIFSVIGSSTAAGTGASTPDSNWVNRLARYYTSLGFTTQAHNLAQGGTDCYHGMPPSYIPPLGRPLPSTTGNIRLACQATPNPEVVIVSFVSNNYNSYSVAEVMFCLQTIKDSANASGKVCYITTSQPRQDGPFPDFPARQKLKIIRDSIMNRFTNFAIDFFTPLADPVTYNILPQYLAIPIDNIHINDAGHKVLFKQVRNKNIFGIGLVNRAISNGNWENPAIWENEEVPTIADSVIILGGRTVTLNSNTEIRALRVTPTATLTITPSRTLKIGN